MFKKIYFLFFLFTIQCGFSQQEYIVSLGINVVDDSFTSQYNPFNTSEQWHIGRVPSFASITAKIAQQTYVDLSITMNEYKKDKIVNGTTLNKNKDYFSYDLAIKYQLFNEYSSIFDTSVFDPFVTLGLGQTVIGSDDFTNINYGLGTYIWFPSTRGYYNVNNSTNGGHFGFVWNTIGKSAMNTPGGNHVQHTFGLSYRF